MKTIQLRGWQREAFELYRNQLTSGQKSVLWEATPGAGKTTAALQVIRHQLENRLAKNAIIVVPTSHLRIQWARAAAKNGIQLDAAFGGSRTKLTSDYHGVVVTYQQIGNGEAAFRSLAARSVVVLDEVHHAGDGLAWGNAIRASLEGSRFILCLSGTAFRSDNNPIPFVSYDSEGISNPDYAYAYGRAVADKVCRPTAVLTYGGDVAWGENDKVYQATFADALDPIASARRLRAALDPDSGWIQPLLKDAHTMLVSTRREHPRAGGLIVCADQEHARKMARCIFEISGERATVVLSDDSGASQKIKQFSDEASLWLVACNMVSEGVDIPRLRVGVYATTVRTKLYFRQFVGRIVRRQQNIPGLQVAYLYVPADPTLHRLAEELEAECRHSLRAGKQPFGDEREARERPDAPERAWTALGASNSGLDAVIVHGSQIALFGDPTAPEHVRAVVDQEVELHIEDQLTRTEQKAFIASEIKRLVGLVHRQTGKTHSTIHTTLNKTQGVRSQVHCTEAQLRERMVLLQRMLEGGKRPERRGRNEAKTL